MDEEFKTPPPAQPAEEEDDEYLVLARAMDPENAESLAMALRLQAEDEARIAEQEAAAMRLQDEPEDAESVALAMRLQQEADDQAVRDALGVLPGEDGESGSPGQYSYEQLMQLGQTIGEVSRGASSDAIESLRTMSFEEARADRSVILGEQCSICRMEFEPGDVLRVLRCNHAEHAECIDQWLNINKSCPLCQVEIASPTPAVCPPAMGGCSPVCPPAMMGGVPAPAAATPVTPA